MQKSEVKFVAWTKFEKSENVLAVMATTIQDRIKLNYESEALNISRFNSGFMELLLI